MTVKKRKFVIADHNLTNFGGHYWEYDAMACRLFAARGHEPYVLAFQGLKGIESTAFVKVVPWFSLSSADLYRPVLYSSLVRITGPLPKPLLVFLRGLYRLLKKATGSFSPPPTNTFGEECLKAIERLELGPDDLLFFQTVHAREIQGLAQVLATVKEPKSLPRLAIMLRREPEEFSMNGLRQPLNILDSLVKDRKVFFCADTDSLARAYSKIYNVPVRTLPILCDLAPIQKAALPPAPKKARTIVYLGGARVEKGFPLLPPLIEELSSTSDLTFLLQAYVPKDEYVGVIAESLKRLRKNPSVVLYEEPLSPEAYINLLLKADIVLLPYEASAYRRRSSGILIQAIAAGKVVVVPEDSWLSNAAPRGGSQSFAPGHLKEAVKAALRDFDALKTGAEKAARAFQFENLLEDFYQGLTG